MHKRFIISGASYLPYVKKSVFYCPITDAKDTALWQAALQFSIIMQPYFCSINPSRKILRYYYKRFFENAAESFLIGYLGQRAIEFCKSIEHENRH
jgi:hypothetical protein